MFHCLNDWLGVMISHKKSANWKHNSTIYLTNECEGIMQRNVTESVTVDWQWMDGGNANKLPIKM